MCENKFPYNRKISCAEASAELKPLTAGKITAIIGESGKHIVAGFDRERIKFTVN
jgi:hypothetical protein